MQATLSAPSLNGNTFNSRIVAWAETHHVWIFFQRVVNYSPIVRVHWLQLYRATGNTHSLGNLPDALSQLIVPHRSPMANVDLNSSRIPILSLKNSIEEKLQIFERLAIVTDQCIAFGRKHLELAAILGLDFLDFRHKAEVTEHRIQYLLGFHFSGVNNYHLAITLSLGNWRSLRDLDKRDIRLVSREVHLGDEEQILDSPV